MSSWITDPYKGKGYILVRYKNGMTELDSIPCSKSCERQETIIYGERLWSPYSDKYQWLKIDDRKPCSRSCERQEINQWLKIDDRKPCSKSCERQEINLEIKLIYIDRKATNCS